MDRGIVYDTCKCTPPETGEVRCVDPVLWSCILKLERKGEFPEALPLKQQLKEPRVKLQGSMFGYRMSEGR